MTYSSNYVIDLRDSGPCKTVEIDTAHEFLDYLSPNGPIFGNLDILSEDFWIFRGHEDSNFKLIPTALRERRKLLCEENITDDSPDEDIQKNDTKAQIRREFKIIKAFFRLSDEQGLPLPEDSQRLRSLLHSFEDLKNKLDRQNEGPAGWPPKELKSLIALAQHHGLPTRLLDWTFDSYTAAWFAAAGTVTVKDLNSKNPANPEKYIDVWALNKSKVITEYNDEKDSNESNYSLEIVTAPGAGNQNLHAQRGLFTMIRHNDCQWEEDAHGESLDDMIYKKYEKSRKGKRAVLLRFQLPHSQVRHLLTLLARQGVTRADLFPGYDGVAQTIHYDQEYWVDLKKPD